MMKKSYLCIISVFVLLFTSCGISPDKMLEEFNNSIENSGAGIYSPNLDKPRFLPALIEKNVYYINVQGARKIAVNNGYCEYIWTLKDNITNQVVDLHNNDYEITINSPILNLQEGREYTLTLLVRNNNDILFKDSAALKVVK